MAWVRLSATSVEYWLHRMLHPDPSQIARTDTHSVRCYLWPDNRWQNPYKNVTSLVLFCYCEWNLAAKHRAGRTTVTPLLLKISIGKNLAMTKIRLQYCKLNRSNSQYRIISWGKHSTTIKQMYSQHIK